MVATRTRLWGEVDNDVSSAALDALADRDQVGQGVALPVGTEVLGWAPMTALADFVLTASDAIVAKPEAMPWTVAGCLGASGQTALSALAALEVGAGDTLLVHAAAGGAGSAAVQIARAAGARVIGTASPANHAYLTGLGATPVEYGPGLIDRVREIAPDGVDAVLDAVGRKVLTDSLELATDRRRIATLVDFDLATRLGVRGVHATRSTAQLERLVALWRDRALRVTIRSQYPMMRAADAHRDVERGHGHGKVVITVREPPSA